MPESKPGIRAAFSSLQIRDYRWFSAALLVFNLVNHMLQVTTAWQIFDLTGSPLQVGFIGLARAIPHLSLSLAGGVIADRVDRIRLMMLSQAAIGLLVLLLGVLTWSGQITVWHVYAITFLTSGVQALASPARTATVPKLVPRERLVNAIGLNATISQSSQIIGPALAGVGIATIGLTFTYLGTGLLTMLSLFALATISPLPAPPAATVSPWRSMVEGVSYVRQNSVIIAFMAMDVAQTLFGAYRGLLPFLAANLGVGPEGFGYLAAAPGAGSVIGAVAIMSLGDMRYKGLFAVAGVLLYCASLVVLALSPWFWLALVAAALLGFFNVVQVVPRNSAIMSMAPDELRGRVEAFRTMLTGGAPSLGQATNGAIATVIGAPLALIVGAATCVVSVVAIAVFHKDLRDPDLGSVRAASVRATPIAPAEAQPQPSRS